MASPEHGFCQHCGSVAADLSTFENPPPVSPLCWMCVNRLYDWKLGRHGRRAPSPAERLMVNDPYTWTDTRETP